MLVVKRNWRAMLFAFYRLRRILGLLKRVCCQRWRRRLIYCFVTVCISCQDLKNWDSKYTDSLSICLKPYSGVAKTLHSERLKEEKFLIKYAVFSKEESLYKTVEELVDFKQSEKLLDNLLLDPCAHAFSFELYNHRYYHKVNIVYAVSTSLISPEAGGLQHQYTIKRVDCTEDGAAFSKRKPIFRGNPTIDIPFLEKEQKKPSTGHVTLFY